MSLVRTSILAGFAACAVAMTPVLAEDDSANVGEADALVIDMMAADFFGFGASGYGAPTAEAAPAWHETFTLTREGDVSYLSDNAFQLDEGLFAPDDDRAWGFTLDVRDATSYIGEVDFAERYSAGAFLNVTPRVRLGGQLRVMDWEQDALTWDGVGDAPEIKLQSAFRF